MYFLFVLEGNVKFLGQQDFLGTTRKMFIVHCPLIYAGLGVGYVWRGSPAEKSTASVHCLACCRSGTWGLAPVFMKYINRSILPGLNAAPCLWRIHVGDVLCICISGLLRFAFAVQSLWSDDIIHFQLLCAVGIILLVKLPQRNRLVHLATFCVHMTSSLSCYSLATVIAVSIACIKVYSICFVLHYRRALLLYAIGWVTHTYL